VLFYIITICQRYRKKIKDATYKAISEVILLFGSIFADAAVS